jgi:hypothetical protein
VVLPNMSIEQKVFRNDTVCQERLQCLAAIGLDVVETILTDMETPISTRLEAAFRIFALCDTRSSSVDDLGQAIVKGIERNGRELAYLETLLKARDSNPERVERRDNNRDGGEQSSS